MSIIPNLITLIRILLVLPLAMLLFNEHYTAGLVIALIAGITDGLDGYLAKRFNWTTRMGSILDPVADKLLLICGFSVLTLHGMLPIWLLWIVIGRDLMIIVGAFFYHYFIDRLEAQPSWISKVNTALQIILLLVILFDQSRIISALPEYIIFGLIYTAALTTLMSGMHYMIIWGNRAYNSTIKQSARVKKLN